MQRLTGSTLKTFEIGGMRRVNKLQEHKEAAAAKKRVWRRTPLRRGSMHR